MLTLLGILASLLSLAVPAGAPVTRVDFEHGALDGWTTVDGQWAGEEASDAPSGARGRARRGAGTRALAHAARRRGRRPHPGLARMNDARLSQAIHGARRPRGPRYRW